MADLVELHRLGVGLVDPLETDTKFLLIDPVVEKVQPALDKTAGHPVRIADIARQTGQVHAFAVNDASKLFCDLPIKRARIPGDRRPTRLQCFRYPPGPFIGIHTSPVSPAPTTGGGRPNTIAVVLAEHPVEIVRIVNVPALDRSLGPTKGRVTVRTPHLVAPRLLGNPRATSRTGFGGLLDHRPLRDIVLLALVIVPILTGKKIDVALETGKVLARGAFSRPGTDETVAPVVLTGPLVMGSRGLRCNSGSGGGAIRWIFRYRRGKNSGLDGILERRLPPTEEVLGVCHLSLQIRNLGFHLSHARADLRDFPVHLHKGHGGRKKCPVPFPQHGLPVFLVGTVHEGGGHVPAEKDGIPHLATVHAVRIHHRSEQIAFDTRRTCGVGTTGALDLAASVAVEVVGADVAAVRHWGFLVWLVGFTCVFL